MIPADKTWKETGIWVNGVEVARSSTTSFIDTTPREPGATPNIQLKNYDRSGNSSNLSPATLAPPFRNTQTAEIEPAAVTPALLNSEVVSVSSAYAAGPFNLVANARNILVETTVTFEPVDVPFIQRRFEIHGIVGSTATSLTGVGRVFINIDGESGSGWLIPVGTYFDHADFRPMQGNLTCSCQTVYQVGMQGSKTAITFGLDVYLPAGDSGQLKNASILVTHHATAEA